MREPRLDAAYFLAWARDVASGDVLGRHGVVGGDPFLLNPLYAYVIAPLVAVFGAVPAPILVVQTLLAGATAALAAAAARRFAGTTAAWTAGIAVAFSTPLVHLDGYVAVSGLAAFLVAGTCFACAPPERDGERRHGPFAAGLWLGLSALARPVVLFALPFVVRLYVRREKSRLRAAALVLLPFAACAGVSFARNVVVSGERVVFTAANGQNLHLGNNEAARRLGAMTTDEFRFDPEGMHEDAQFRLGSEFGRKPTRSEISDYFAHLAFGELRAHTGASLVWYGEKTRWFFSPTEPASSADYGYDLALTPMLRLAFVPTWLLAALAVAGAVVRRDRSDLLLGPGALVFAHLAACTLTFPLSHYRGPAVPAMAVLAGCAVAAAADGLRAGRGRALVVVAATAGLVGIAGAVGAQPQYQQQVLLANGAIVERMEGDLDAAERDCRSALEIDPGFLGAVLVLVDVGRARRRPDLARPWAERLVHEQPWNGLYQLSLARVEFESGDEKAARERTERTLKTFPWSGGLHCDAGQLFLQMNDTVRAAQELKAALDLGTMPPDWALAQAGLNPK